MIIFFKELLLSESQNEDRFPIVFLKDVKYVDIECLVKYIYIGKTEVTAANMASCTQLAETLGSMNTVLEFHIVSSEITVLLISESPRPHSLCK